MAKKKPARKKTAGGSSSRAASGSRAKTSKKKTTKSSKKTASKTARKKAPASKAATKSSGKSTPATSTTKKSTAKKATTKKTTTRKTASKKAAARKPTKKTATKKAATKKTAKKTTKKTAAKPDSPAKDQHKKSGRKGITIVKQKPTRKSSSSAGSVTIPTFGSGILGPGAPKRKPLIPSGPPLTDKAGGESADEQRLKKSPFKKRELNRFREILLGKRRELIGDVSTMENEALRNQSGGTSHLPQHMAEQGSDTYDQAISLDLAAADRQLIREIDAALRRIEDGTYGICELTGRPIRPDRLEELPWARYSIDAARELERRST